MIYTNKFILAASIVLLFCCAPTVQQRPVPAAQRTFDYEIVLDIRNPADDLFSVMMHFQNLSIENHTFQFLPGGAYSQINFAEMVQNFSAYDARGNISPVRQTGPARWRLLNPAEVVKISYQVADTRDLSETHRPPEMLGTALDPYYAYVNGGGVFGVLRGLERAPLRLQLLLPGDWQSGTALPADANGYFYAADFGELVTSPILAGYLTVITERIMGSNVRIFCYSKTDLVSADALLAPTRDVITATYHFLNNRLPLDDYTMLFVFEDQFAGGVQYAASAAFVFAEDRLENIRTDVQDVIAHEYFHLVIPYSIRSDALNIEDHFSGKPTQHLWFFEGVTEWASDIIQLRGGLKTLEHYVIEDFRQKIIREELFGSETSLRDMSLQARGNPRDYANVYSRGALVAALLDIHLIDLTAGRRGLREVLNDLLLDYGKERPLPEERFFEILIDYCGPEFDPFIRRYIIGNAPLPYAEMLEKVGITFKPWQYARPVRPDFGFFAGENERNVAIVWADSALADAGIRKNDILLSVAGQPVTPANYRDILYEKLLPNMDIGEKYPLQLLRDGRIINRTATMLQHKERYIFSVPRMLSPAQQRVRDMWLNRLN